MVMQDAKLPALAQFGNSRQVRQTCRFSCSTGFPAALPRSGDKNCADQDANRLEHQVTTHGERRLKQAALPKRF
jgi:hypothetical protein